jgi:hypothetical protein
LSSANMPPENPQANRVIFDLEKVRVPRVVGCEDVVATYFFARFVRIQGATFYE